MPIKLNLPTQVQISKVLLFPALATMIEKRREALLLSGIAALQFGLVTAGLPGWPCPFKAVFGIPCPGCGLSTSISYLLYGDWNGALITHAFAPIFLLGLVFVLSVNILPEAVRTAVVQKVATVEKKTGITTLLMVALLLYWGFRLIRL